MELADEHKRQFDEAYESKSLIDLVRHMNRQGMSQVQIYELFSNYHLYLRKIGYTTAEDEVAEVMDFIIGYCSPEVKLFDHYLTNEEIEAYRLKNL